jgi:hypothetical protein
VHRGNFPLLPQNMAGSSSSSSSSSASSSSSTYGRERAIETLLDREPNGNFYRAARVLVSEVKECSSFLSFLERIPMPYSQCGVFIFCFFFN